MEMSWQTSSATAASVSPGRPDPGTLSSVIVVILFRTATKTYDGPHARVAAKLSLKAGETGHEAGGGEQ